MAEQLTAEVAAFPLQTGGASMANDEHVALLKQGVTAWNAWRVVNPGIRPELSGADFSRENLRRADLRSANLRGTRLIDTDLSGALLSRADLREAECSSETDFGEA